jgi:hypothetical protein
MTYKECLHISPFCPHPSPNCPVPEQSGAALTLQRRVASPHTRMPGGRGLCVSWYHVGRWRPRPYQVGKNLHRRINCTVSIRQGGTAYGLRSMPLCQDGACAPHIHPHKWPYCDVSVTLGTVIVTYVSHLAHCPYHIWWYVDSRTLYI